MDYMDFGVQLLKKFNVSNYEIRSIALIFLHWIAGRHCTKAFPSIPGGQVHIGTWFITSHNAFWPHVPGHGSTHLLRMHALFRAQSEFKTHSGRHPEYGSPWYSGKQEQIPLLHKAFGPHGEGLQGSSNSGSFSGTIYDFILEIVLLDRKKNCLRGGGCGRQLVNGSPIYPSMHWQFGIWLSTEHTAKLPQDPGQGSTHFSRIQALSLAHSEFIVHSGRQLGGRPIYVFRHEHDGTPFIFRHSAFNPHGDG